MKMPNSSKISRFGLKISVVTPSYKQLSWLKLCAASVEDQEGVEVEHIIQDAGLDPELAEWVHGHTRAKLYQEKDKGMYDAIDRGFARATGDVVCWLNCDEQYMVGALAKVAAFFESHPDVEVLFTDALLIGQGGELISYRRTIPPSLLHIRLAHLNTLSCSMFVRRSIIVRFKLDPSLKDIADAVWVATMLESGVKMAVLNEPLALFTFTGANMSAAGNARSEAQKWRQEKAGILWMRPFVVGWHRVKKLLHGAYSRRSVEARYYTLASPTQRVTQSSSSIGYHWPK
jgi:glycosyltransferase involved in cell wall biosynthesis